MNKGFISRKKEVNAVNNIIKDYNVKASSIRQEVKFMSGGNQQKLIIARAMSCKPSVLIFDEPTKGIDVGTKTEVYRMMKRISEDEGVGIILISSEMNELTRCSNRIISLYKGKKVAEHSRGASKEELVSSILGLNVRKTEGNNHEYKVN
jgi:ribose transport system ATP-binding protein